MTQPHSQSAQVVTWYRRLYLCRACEERVRAEYPKDEMKTPVHLSIGAEAIAVGVLSAAPPATPVFATYRNHAAYLARTDDVEGFFAELYGRRTGRSKGKAGSMHLSYPNRGLILSSAIVGSTIPVAAGMALAHQYLSCQDPVIAFFGDGAVEEGVFWETLNFACLCALPLLFVCEDNGLAIHSLNHDRKGFDSISDVAKRFRCHVESDEGRDVSRVAQIADAALARMRAKPAPVFLHLTYHRFLEHVGIREDYAAGYRPTPSPAERLAWDPLHIIEETALQQGATHTELEEIRVQVDARIDDAVRAALQAPSPSSDELRADMPD